MARKSFPRLAFDAAKHWVSTRAAKISLGHPRDPVLARWLGLGAATHGGPVVTPETALKHAAVYSSVRILSESLAALPLVLFRSLPGGGAARAIDHPLYSQLHDLSNEHHTSFEAREMGQGHLCLRGNAYYETPRSRRSGTVGEILPLHPDGVRPFRLESGRIAYEVAEPGRSNRTLLSNAGEIWHVRGLGFDGIQGFSPITVARQAIGLGLAAEEYGGKFFAGGAHHRGFLKYPGQLSNQAKTNLEESWQANYGSLSNVHKVAVLEEGLEWQQIGISNEDSQFLETRKFQVAEIARIFRVPPHFLADLDRATFSNIEQQSLDFVVYSLLPWFRRWEQSIYRDLLTPAERQQYHAKFIVEGFLRGDSKSRKDFYASARQWGWMNVDEIREKEDLNPLPNGEGQIFLQPGNMNPLGSTPDREDDSEGNDQ